MDRSLLVEMKSKIKSRIKEEFTSQKARSLKAILIMFLFILYKKALEYLKDWTLALLTHYLVGEIDRFLEKKQCPYFIFSWLML